MAYYYSRIVDLPFGRAVEAVVENLKDQGFGVLTDIDIAGTLKKKLDVGFRRYRILGACNPTMALKALQIENKIGTMLPCNVIVQQLDDGRIEVAAIDPVESMRRVGNEDLLEVAQHVRYLLTAAVDGVGSS